MSESANEGAWKATKMGEDLLSEPHRTTQTPANSDGHGADEGTESRPAEVAGSVHKRAAELVADLRIPSTLTPYSNGDSEGSNIWEVSSIQRDKAAELVAEMRTPTDLASNINDEGQDFNVVDKSNIQKVDSRSDSGEKAARSFMSTMSEAQDALFSHHVKP